MTPEMRELLATVVEVLDPPMPAYVKDREARQDLLWERAASVAGVLRALLEPVVPELPPEPRHAMRALRAELDRPIPYEVKPEDGEA